MFRILKKIIKLYRLVKYKPKLEVSNHQLNLLRLGTGYGGWTFADYPELHKSTIISCGLGEHASFDVEFASKYKSKVILVDPTPRSLQHFSEIINRVGLRATSKYLNNGEELATSYNLSEISGESFEIIPKALWSENKKLKFYLPPNTEHVSHSILNFQNNYRVDTDHIEVDSITIDQIFATHGLKKIELIKLDIEGAEIEVIEQMLSKKIYPRQILIEYDELLAPSKRSKNRIEKCHKKLLETGYKLINFDKPSNFLYCRIF